MKVRNISLIGLACLLAACGGGGGAQSGGEQPAVQQPAAPQTYTAAAVTVGDYSSYKEETTIDGKTNSPNYLTSTISNVAKDGARSIKDVTRFVMTTEPLELGYSALNYEFDSEGRLVSETDGFCTTTVKPAVIPVAPNTITPGMSWQSTGIRENQCGNGKIKQTTFEYKNTVGALEQVTVAAGTFSAFKVSRTSTSDSETASTVGEQTCWWAPDLGIELKCLRKSVRTTKATGVIRTVESTSELQGFSVQKLARKQNTVQRFMGTWNGSFSGASTGTCKLSFVPDGVIKGNCDGAAIAFEVTGKIDADGNLSFNLGANGATGQTFTGKVDNAKQISGLWSVPNVGSGTWMITQD